MEYLLIVTHIAAFVGGWAFFKHRQDLKDKAKAEIQKVVNKI